MKKLIVKVLVLLYSILVTLHLAACMGEFPSDIGTAVLPETSEATQSSTDTFLPSETSEAIQQYKDISDDFECPIFLEEIRRQLGKTGVSYSGNIYLSAIYDVDVVDIKWLYLEDMGITSLAGIEYFTSLEVLDARNNLLTELDITDMPNLREINVRGNLLNMFNISNVPEIEVIQVENNELTKLNVSNCPKLSVLNAGNNQLTELDVSSNPNLISLAVHGNRLICIDISKNPSLTGLYVNSNRLTDLDVSFNLELDELIAFDNQLTEINVSRNSSLRRLEIRLNQLTTLDVAQNTKLVFLDIRWNNIAQPDDIAGWQDVNMTIYKEVYTTDQVEISWESYSLEIANNPSLWFYPQHEALA